MSPAHGLNPRGLRNRFLPPAELYVGYRKTAPPEATRFVRNRVSCLIIACVVIAILLVISQKPFAASFYEFGNIRTFRGVIIDNPYPVLVLDRPENRVPSTVSSYLLVLPGKRGAQLHGLGERHVELKGTLIYRGNRTMIEVDPDSVSIIKKIPSAAHFDRRSEKLGTFALRGEIVDSKCYFGVMKPAHLKPHRSCAVRCISGGIPPVFRVRDQRGHELTLLLAGAHGQSVNNDVLDLVAEPLEIKGEVWWQDDILVLYADPTTYKRLQ